MRHQQGSFAQAFSKHCERFGDDNEKARKWREALKEVADLSAGAPRLHLKQNPLENFSQRYGKGYNPNCLAMTVNWLELIQG